MHDAPRYEVRWANGCWRLFDSHKYTTVAAFGLHREAEAALERANAPRPAHRGLRRGR